MQEEKIESLVTLGHLYLLHGKEEMARTIFEGIRAVSAGRPDLARALSFVYCRLGEYGKALDEAETVLGSSNGREGGGRDMELGLLLKSRALWGLGRKEEATALYRKAAVLRRNGAA